MVAMEAIWQANGHNSGRWYSYPAVTITYADFANSGQITGWAGLIRVDGTTYTWMGAPNVANSTVTQTAFEYTSTQSIFTLNAGSAIQMKVTFLSPLTPDDFERQSLVSNYLNVEVSSLDGKSHSVQLYADISAGKKSQGYILCSPVLIFHRMGIWRSVLNCSMGL